MALLGVARCCHGSAKECERGVASHYPISTKLSTDKPGESKSTDKPGESNGRNAERRERELPSRLQSDSAVEAQFQLAPFPETGSGESARRGSSAGTWLREKRERERCGGVMGHGNSLLSSGERPANIW